MTTKAVRYTQPLLGSTSTDPHLVAVHDADEVLITQDGVACDVFADNDRTPLENPVTLGVAPGTAGVSTRGELLVYFAAGRGYGAQVTVGADVTTVAFPDVSPDVGDVVDTSSDQTYAGEKRATEVATFDELVRVKGRSYADITHPMFGADPLGGVPAHVAAKNAYDSLLDGGELYIPGGDFLCEDTLLWRGNKRIKLRTDGTSSVLIFAPPVGVDLDDGLRIEECPEFSAGGLRVRLSGALGGAVRRLVTLTATDSAENLTLRDMVIDPQREGVTHMLAIGPDTSADVAEVLLENVQCAGVGCSDAVLLLGNGTAGNVTNIRALGCLFALGLYGIVCDGAMLHLLASTLQKNSGADIKVITPGGAPLVIDGVRSEGSRKFLENLQNSAAIGPVSFRNIRVEDFTDPDGHVIDWACLSAVDLENFTAFGGPVPGRFAFSSPGDPDHPHRRASVTAKNILTESPNPFIPHSNVDVNWIGPRRYLDADLLPAEIVPTVSVLAAAGTGATATVDGDDFRGSVTLTTGPDATAGGLVRVTYGSRISNKTPRVAITGTSASAMVTPAGIFFGGPDYFEIYVPSAPFGSSVYAWNYVIGW